MKNLFFTLALMLVGTFAFANTNKEVTSDINLDKIERLINVDNLEIAVDLEDAASCGFYISFETAEGSGSFWYDCSDDNSGNADLLGDTLACLFWDCSWASWNR